MDRTERAIELLQLGEEFGIHVTFDSGLVVAKKTSLADPGRQQDVIVELGKHITDVHRVVKLRAVAARAQQLVSQRVWMPESGDGVLLGAHNDGTLIVSCDGARCRSVQAYAETLLVLVQASTHSACDLTDSERSPARPRRFPRLRRRIRQLGDYARRSLAGSSGRREANG